MASFSMLPQELALQVIENISDQATLNALLPTCRSMHALVVPTPYERNAISVRNDTQHRTVSAINWGAENGFLGTVKLAFEFGAYLEGAEPHAIGDDDDGYLWPAHRGTPLQQAAHRGHDEIVQFLVDNGANTDTGTDICGCQYPAGAVIDDDTTRPLWRPLHLAICGSGRLSTIKILTACRSDHEVSVPRVDAHGNHIAVTAVQPAAETGDVDLVDYFLTSGCPSDSNILLYAAKCTRKDLIPGLIKLCVERGLFSFRDNTPSFLGPLAGASTLQYLCADGVGAVAFANEILKYEGSFQEGDPSLVDALYYSHGGVYSRGFRLRYMTDRPGRFQTEFETRQDARRLVEKLFRKSRDITGNIDHVSPACRCTALQMAATLGLSEMVEEFINVGADPLLEVFVPAGEDPLMEIDGPQLEPYTDQILLPIELYILCYTRCRSRRPSPLHDGERVGGALLAYTLSRMGGEHPVASLFEKVVSAPTCPAYVKIAKKVLPQTTQTTHLLQPVHALHLLGSRLSVSPKLFSPAPWGMHNQPNYGTQCRGCSRISR